MEKETQFKIIAYANSRDYTFKRNGKVFTNIEDLLTYINKTSYYTVRGGNIVECTCQDDFIYGYKQCIASTDNSLYKIDIIDKPTDIKTRIIGISDYYAFPQINNNVIYDNIDDARLSNIKREAMRLYPYTIEEFINVLNKELSIKNSDFFNWDYIALKHI